MTNDKIILSKTFIENILKPINRLTESCVLRIENDNIYSLCTSSNNVVILYVSGKLKQSVNENIRLNLIDIKRFLCGLDCLDGENFSLEYLGNNIKCESVDDQENATFFKYHLVDDTVIPVSPVNIQKMSQLPFDTEFEIAPDKQKRIISAYTFTSAVPKIYLYTKDKSVHAELNDRQVQNIDNMTLKISDNFTGTDIEDSIPVNMEIFKSLTSSKQNIKVKINNQYKVLIFQNTERDDIVVKYITSALVK
jgi:hypothetical protein